MWRRCVAGCLSGHECYHSYPIGEEFWSQIASALWHKMNVLDPPDDIVHELQRRLVNFFWTGQHWTKAAVLFLPINEGGQGLIDIKSRIKIPLRNCYTKLMFLNMTCICF